MLVSPNAMHLLLKHHVVAQHPAVYFCVVMTVLEDSFRLGRQRGYYLIQSPDSLSLRCSWSRQQVAAVTAPARIHCFSSTSGLGLPSRVHATGSSVKAWAQKVWSSPAMEKGEGTSGCCGRSVSPAQNRWWNVPLVSLGSAGHSIKHIVPLDHLAQMTTARCRNSKGGTLTANRWVHQDLKGGDWQFRPAEFRRLNFWTKFRARLVQSGGLVPIFIDMWCLLTPWLVTILRGCLAELKLWDLSRIFGLMRVW